MKTKKILSVLLALLMTLSLGAVAFADPVWTPIPTSPEGLSDGDVYIDFTNFLTVQMEGQDISAEDLAKMIALYNGGDWLFDYNAAKLKGSFVVPADMSDTGTEQTIEFSEDNATSMLPFILNEVGAQWLPVAKSTEFLWDGDYYIDWSALNQAQIDFLEDVYIYYNPGSTYMELMFTPDQLQFVYYPLNADSIGFLVRDLEIKQFSDPYTWTSIPTSPDGLAEGDYYLDFSHDWEAWSPDVRQNRLDMFNGGTWFVDHQNKMLRGSFTVPASMSETGVAYVRSIAPNTEMYLQTIMRVGNWVKIPTSPDGLSNGDFYMDVAALAALLGTTEADLNSAGAEYYGDALSGDIYMTVPGYSRTYFGDDASVRACMVEIKTVTPTDPETPTDPGTPETPEDPAPSQTTSPIQRIVKAITSFFLRMVDFFKKMFSK